MVDAGAVGGNADTLSVSVDELVEGASSAREGRIRAITESAFTLNKSVVSGTGITMEDVSEVKAVSGKSVALLVDKKLSSGARRNTYSS